MKGGKAGRARKSANTRVERTNSSGGPAKSARNGAVKPVWNSTRPKKGGSDDDEATVTPPSSTRRGR